MMMRWISTVGLAAMLAVASGTAFAAPTASPEGKTALWCSAAYVMVAEATKEKDPKTAAEISEQSGVLSRKARAILTKDGFTDTEIQAMIDKTATEVADDFGSNNSPPFTKDDCRKVLGG
jgi:hypothetical protein